MTREIILSRNCRSLIIYNPLDKILALADDNVRKRYGRLLMFHIVAARVLGRFCVAPLQLPPNVN